MKKLTAILAITLLAPIAVFAASFEGKIAMQTASEQGETMPMTFSLKPGLSRIDMSAKGHDISVILDQTKKQMIVLMPERSVYIVRPLPSSNQDPANPRPASQNAVQVEKTSQHEKILGYDTTKYVAKTKEGTTEAWVTDELGTFMGLGNAGGNPMGGGRPNGPAHMIWQDAFRGRDAFPLRVITTNAKGVQIFKLEATSVEKQSLPDTIFAPPPDFQKFDMENMMRGMGMPGGMRGLPGGMRPPQEGN